MKENRPASMADLENDRINRKRTIKHKNAIPKNINRKGSISLNTITSIFLVYTKTTGNIDTTRICIKEIMISFLFFNVFI